MEKRLGNTDVDHCRTLVMLVMDLRSPQKAGNVSTI
jgi:hypothetical protein